MSNFSSFLQVVKDTVNQPESMASPIALTDNGELHFQSTIALAGLEKRIAALEARKDINNSATVQQSPRAVNARSPTVAPRLDSELSQFEIMFNSLEARLHDLETDVDNRADETAKTRGHIAQLEIAVRATETVLAETQERLRHLEETIRPFNEYRSGIDKAIGQIHEFDQVIRDNKPGGTNQDLNDRLARQEEQVRGLAAMVVNLGPKTGASRAARAKTASARAQILLRRLQRQTATENKPDPASLAPPPPTQPPIDEEDPADDAQPVDKSWLSEDGRASSSSSIPKQRRAKRGTRPSPGPVTEDRPLRTAIKTAVRRRKHSKANLGDSPSSVRRTSRAHRPTEREEAYKKWQISNQRHRRKTMS